MYLYNKNYTHTWITIDTKTGKESVPIYSYKSKDKLYDIMIYDNSKFYRTNMKEWSNLIDKITPYHY